MISLVRIAVLALALSGSSQPASGQATTTTPPIPPPGQMIDLGGWRVHLHCTGTGQPGQPTVLLEALSRGRADFRDAEAEAEHGRNQAELLRLSRSARHVVADASGHEILMEQPDLVVTAIREVVAAARR